MSSVILSGTKKKTRSKQLNLYLVKTRWIFIKTRVYLSRQCGCAETIKSWLCTALFSSKLQLKWGPCLFSSLSSLACVFTSCKMLLTKNTFYFRQEWFPITGRSSESPCNMQLTMRAQRSFWICNQNTNSVVKKRRGKHTHGTSSHLHKTEDYVGFSAGVGIYNVLFLIISLIFAEY